MMREKNKINYSLVGTHLVVVVKLVVDSPLMYGQTFQRKNKTLNAKMKNK